MKKWYSLPGLIFAIGFLSTSAFFIHKSTEAAEKFRLEKSKIGKILNFNDRLLSFRDWVFTEDAWKEKKAVFDQTMVTADQHLEEAQRYGSYLLVASLIFLLIVVIWYARKRLFFGLTFAFTFVAMVLLGEGVLNPILEMSAFKENLTIKFYVHADEIPYFEEAVEYMDDVVEFMGAANSTIELIGIIPGTEGLIEKPKEVLVDAQAHLREGQAYLRDHKDSQIGINKVFPGKTYFYYQNKGIVEVVNLLWKTDNKPVAVAIGTFSIIVPLIKLLFTFVMLLFPIQGAKRMRKFISYISKWSMADVFVVSAFLAYLSFANMSPGVTMDAQILFGLYYFMGYVVVSIALGILLDFAIKEKQKLWENEIPVMNPQIEERS